jgi:hypothetical protein
MSESEVTFVNGHAESQTTEGESAIPTDDRAAAIAAVKAAIKNEGESAAKEAKEAVEQDPLRPRDNVERGADGKFVAKDEKKEPVTAPPVEEDEHALKRVLRERKQIAERKAVQEQEFNQRAQQLRQYEAQIAAREQKLAQDARRMEALRKDPARAIKENGWDPEDFILTLAREGTPEGQAMRQQRALQEQLQELAAWKKSQEDQRAQQEERYKLQRERTYRQQVEQKFVSVALNEEKHPLLTEMYGEHQQALLAEADLVAEQYRHLTGKEASFEDVAEYLEERAGEWYNRVSKKRGQQAPSSGTKGKPTQGNATGTTLSPEGSSERRTQGTILKDLDGDERLAAAREAVGIAMRASGERK